ncbi:hypothetical protein L211DRAFT_853496 [Terfezia boudieri ATCC MYA-4762]|uniref:Uncharacterized protein n=1 Tax=Terfezia boudieri ATCC MYA-4762 TaxID=1051890 RepID=A0A3N4L866_9PEZI|nr:hypothetical protein L211DRAFT_853496 [Terfezia boudieri ATCC MYA-4762]
MSKKGKGLFFPIQPHWNKDKLAVIIDGKAYRSLESYNIWETKETTKGLIDAVARGSLLIDHNTTVPDSVSNSPDPNPYTSDQQALKTEMQAQALEPKLQDPDLEAVTEQDIPPTSFLEKQLTRLNLYMEEEREIKEAEATDILTQIDKSHESLSKKTQEGFQVIFKIVEANHQQIQALTRAFSHLNDHVSKQLIPTRVGKYNPYPKVLVKHADQRGEEV